MGLTDGRGQILFNCIPGSHRVRAWKGEVLIGTWIIVAKAGYRSEIELPTGKAHIVGELVTLPPRAPYRPIPEGVTSAASGP